MVTKTLNVVARIGDDEHFACASGEARLALIWKKLRKLERILARRRKK